jgi:aubergine-like protein
MKFKMGVIGSIIKTTYNNQTYRIDDIDEDSNTQSIFCLKDGSRMSYVDYYQQVYYL